MSVIEIHKHQNDKNWRRRAIFKILIATTATLLLIWFFRTQPPLSRGEIICGLGDESNYQWINSHQLIVQEGNSTRRNAINQPSSIFYKYDIDRHASTRLEGLNSAATKVENANRPTAYYDFFSPDGNWTIRSSFRYNADRQIHREYQYFLISTDGATRRHLKSVKASTSIAWNKDSSAFLATTRRLDINKAHPYYNELMIASVKKPDQPVPVRDKLDSINRHVQGFLNDGSLAIRELNPDALNPASRIVCLNSATGNIEKTYPWIKKTTTPGFNEELKKTDRNMSLNPIFETLSPDGKYILSGYFKIDPNVRELPKPLEFFTTHITIHLVAIKTDGSGIIDLGRTYSRYNLDIKSFRWLPDSKHISFAKDGKLWVYPIQ